MHEVVQRKSGFRERTPAIERDNSNGKGGKLTNRKLPQHVALDSQNFCMAAFAKLVHENCPSMAVSFLTATSAVAVA